MVPDHTPGVYATVAAHVSKQLALTRTLARHVQQDAARDQVEHQQEPGGLSEPGLQRRERLTEDKEPEGDRAVTVGGSRRSGSFGLLFIIVSV